MFNSIFGNWGSGVPDGMMWLGALVPILVVWSLFWKGFALWRSAQNRQGWWFLILLIVNTMGILEIIYLFAVDGGKFWHELTAKLGKKSHEHYQG